MAVGPASTPEPASAADSASEVSRIKKGLTMRVTVYIEGEDAPAHDFVQTGLQIINRLFSPKAIARYSEEDRAARRLGRFGRGLARHVSRASGARRSRSSGVRGIGTLPRTGGARCQA